MRGLGDDGYEPGSGLDKLDVGREEKPQRARKPGLQGQMICYRGENAGKFCDVFGETGVVALL